MSARCPSWRPLFGACSCSCSEVGTCWLDGGEGECGCWVEEVGECGRMRSCMHWCRKKPKTNRHGRAKTTGPDRDRYGNVNSKAPLSQTGKLTGTSSSPMDVPLRSASHIQMVGEVEDGPPLKRPAKSLQYYRQPTGDDALDSRPLTCGELSGRHPGACTAAARA